MARGPKRAPGGMGQEEIKKREKSSDVTCCMKKRSTRRASKYASNAKPASSLSYMQATAASKSSSPFEAMHTQWKMDTHQAYN